MEIGRLTSVFDADTRKFDASLKASEERIKSLRASIASIKTDDIGGKSQRISALKTLLDKALTDHKTLQSAQRATAQSAKEMSRDIEQALSAISPRLGNLIGMAGPLTLLAGGFVANAAAVAGLGVALFEITRSASEFGSKIHDAAQEAGSTAETISTLAYAAKLSSKNLDDITPAIKKFEVTIGDAAKGSKQATAALIRLGIDPKKAINDLDGSLAQAFKSIHKAGGGIAQVNLAADAFGKRAGPAMISVVETANGDFVKFSDHAKELGVVLSTDAANAADEFGDKLDEVTERVKFLGIQFGLRLAPQILDALNVIDRGISDLPKTIAVATAATQALLETEVIGPLRIIEALLNALEHPHSIPITVLFSGPPALMAYFLGQGAGQKQNVGIDVGLPSFPKKSPAYGGGGGGGRRGGGGGEDPAKIAERLAKMQLDAVVAGLRAEQEANKRALDLRRRDFNDYATQYMVIETRRHDAVVAGLDREQKAAEKLKKGREVALQEVSNKRADETITHEQNRNKILDERADILDQIDKFLRDQDRDIARLTNSTDQWDQSYQQLVDTLKEEGVTLEENTRIRIESNNALAREKELVLSVTRARQVLQSVRERFATKAGRERPSWEDLGGGSTVGGEPATTERPRIATVDEQVTRERLAKIREQMHELAGDLTNVFSQSIGDGFNNGIKSGLQTLAQGLLQIVQDVFLKRMAQGLGDMLSNVAGGQGGGFFGSLLRGLIGGVSGGLGGSIGGLGSASAGGVGTVFAGAIGRASGGPIWPNQLYKVHKDEYIMPTAPGFVLPKGAAHGQQKVVNNHYTIQLPPDSRGSYNSPKSRRQLSETLIAALEATRP